METNKSTDSEYESDIPTAEALELCTPEYLADDVLPDGFTDADAPTMTEAEFREADHAIHNAMSIINQEQMQMRQCLLLIYECKGWMRGSYTSFEDYAERTFNKPHKYGYRVRDAAIVERRLVRRYAEYASAPMKQNALLLLFDNVRTPDLQARIFEKAKELSGGSKAPTADNIRKAAAGKEFNIKIPPPPQSKEYLELPDGRRLSVEDSGTVLVKSIGRGGRDERIDWQKFAALLDLAA